MENHDEDMVPSVPVAITNQCVINWFVTTRNNENGVPAKKKEFWTCFSSSFGYELDQCNADTFYNKVLSLPKNVKLMRGKKEGNSSLILCLCCQDVNRMMKGSLMLLVLQPKGNCCQPFKR